MVSLSKITILSTYFFYPQDHQQASDSEVCVLFYKKKVKPLRANPISKLLTKISLLPSKFQESKERGYTINKDLPTHKTVHTQQSDYDKHSCNITSASQRPYSVPQPMEHKLSEETTPYCEVMNTLPSSLDPMNITRQVALMSIQGTNTMYNATGSDLIESKPCMIEDIAVT